MTNKRENKRYWFLRLPEDFFSNPVLKKLRRLAGGDTYCIIYLKLQLLSLKNEGYLFYEGIETEIETELALILDEAVEDVSVTFAYLIKNGLVIEAEDPEYIKYFIPEAAERIGSITDSSLRARKSRLKQQSESVLQCNTNAAQLQHTCVALQQSKNVNSSNEVIATDSEGVLHCNTNATQMQPRYRERDRTRTRDRTREREEEENALAPYGVMENILLTKDEYSQLTEKYQKTVELIDFVSCILANTSSGEKKDIFAFIHKIAIQEDWPRNSAEKKAKQEQNREIIEIMEKHGFETEQEAAEYIKAQAADDEAWYEEKKVEYGVSTREEVNKIYARNRVNDLKNKI